MDIAAYCRVSTDKQDQLNSLKAQKEFFSEYTRRTGDRLVCLYADEGISGTKLKRRREFLRMMEDAELGMFQMVIVKDISRFARNTVDLLQSIRRLKALGIETRFLTADMTSMGNSEFVLTIFGALAQEESAGISKRVKFGKRLNAEKGRVPNLVYGYNKRKGEYFDMTVNEAEAAVVRQIFVWYVREGCGCAKIAARLNERGLRTKRDYLWNQKGVCGILSNPLYTGKIINGKQEVEDFLTGRRVDKDESEWLIVDRPELRIVEPELFAEAQSVLRSRRDAFGDEAGRPDGRYLFSTLIRCRDCGRSFRRTVRTYRNTYVRWVCSGHNAGGDGTCSNAVTVDEAELTGVLQEYFTGILKAKKDAARCAAAELRRIWKTGRDSAGSRKEIRARLSRLRTARQRYMDMYTDGLISRGELNERIGTMREEIDRLEKELKQANSPLPKEEQLETVFRNLSGTAVGAVCVSRLTNAELKRIIRKIEVDGDGNVDIHLRLFRDTGSGGTVLTAGYGT